MTWNEKLQHARMEKGFSQQQIADLLSITRGCYAHYEQGIREPSIAILKKLCDIFEFSADYLIGRTENY